MKEAVVPIFHKQKMGKSIMKVPILRVRLHIAPSTQKMGKKLILICKIIEQIDLVTIYFYC